MQETTVELSPEDASWLRSELKGSEFCYQERIRARILLMSDKGLKRQDIVKALETSSSTVSRTRGRFIQSGCGEAVLEKVGARGAKRALSASDEQIIASIACTSPPEGYAVWTTQLILTQARKKGVGKVSVETVRCCLRDHKIRPWREKNVGDSQDGRRLHHQDEPPSGGSESRL